MLTCTGPWPATVTLAYRRRPTGWSARRRTSRRGCGTLVGLLDDLGVQLRDPEMGLVDFPGERDGEPVWLCWRLADPEVAHWHRTDEGYASRRPW